MVKRSQYSLASTLLKVGFFKQVSELKIQREKFRQCFTIKRSERKEMRTSLRFKKEKIKRKEEV